MGCIFGKPPPSRLARFSLAHSAAFGFQTVGTAVAVWGVNSEALEVLGRFCGLLQFSFHSRLFDLFGSAKTSGDPEATLQSLGKRLYSQEMPKDSWNLVHGPGSIRGSGKLVRQERLPSMELWKNPGSLSNKEKSLSYTSAAKISNDIVF